MSRRDFLFFRTDESRRVVELSCERLYMQYLDSQLTWGSREDAGPGDADLWGGEPSAMFEPRTAEQLFAELERDLQGADILIVAEPQWLASEPLGRRIETLIASVVARGGKVEFTDGLRRGRLC